MDLEAAHRVKIVGLDGVGEEAAGEALALEKVVERGGGCGRKNKEEEERECEQRWCQKHCEELRDRDECLRFSLLNV